MRSEVWVRRLRGAERLASGRFFLAQFNSDDFYRNCDLCPRAPGPWCRTSESPLGQNFSVRAGGRFERVFRVAGRERGSRA